MNVTKISTPIKIDQVTIIPIIRQQLWQNFTKSSGGFYATKQIAALVVCRPEGSTAYDESFIVMPLNRLLRQYPELEAVLNQYSY